VPAENTSRTPSDLQYSADAPFGLSRTGRRLLRFFKHRVGDIELLLPLYLWATPLGTSRQLTADTELVIEGKPRSGNTFARRAMEQAADEPTSISSHAHVPSAVVRAVRRGCPTLVLVRQPIDSICSEKIAAPHASLASVIRAWIHYYEKIWPYRDGYVVATFDQVVTDFGGVTDRLNRRFGTSFARFENSAENDDLVFGVIEQQHRAVHGDTENIVPRPSSARHDAKDELLGRLEDPKFEQALARAAAVYRRYAERAETSQL